MTAIARAARRPGPAAVAATLFAVLFAAQAGVVVLTPVVPDVSADFDVSVAGAGRLRIWSALTAGVGALVLSRLRLRAPAGDLLAWGLALLAAGSLASAAAPSLPLLAAAQAVVGAGLAVLLSASVTAAAEWSPPDRQGQALAWAFAGPPTAWIAGLPLAAVAGAGSWRAAWIVLPFSASALALGALAAVRHGGPAARAAAAPATGGRGDGLSAWIAGETLMFAAWGGTLVYVGALLRESYGMSVAGTGVALGLAAAAYLPGTFLARRWSAAAGGRRMTVLTGVAAAGLVAALGAVRPAPAVSVALFAALAFVAAVRTFAGGLRALEQGRRRGAAAGARAASMQFGYLAGAGVGALAVDHGGYGAMGASFAALFIVSLLPSSAGDRRG